LLEKFKALQIVRIKDEVQYAHLEKSRVKNQVTNIIRQIHFNALLATGHNDNARAFQGRMIDVVLPNTIPCTYNMSLGAAMSRNGVGLEWM
jgi:hypothetical protein